MKIQYLVYLSLLVLMPAHAGKLSDVSECSPGKTVLTRSGTVGAVTEIRNGMCVVRHDDGSEKSYLHWMLSSANGASEPAVSGLKAGNYVCSAYGAGSFKIVIRVGGAYQDRAGNNGKFSLKNDKEIAFESGSLKGQYSRLLAPGKFGLASRKGKMFNTVCNLK